MVSSWFDRLTMRVGTLNFILSLSKDEAKTSGFFSKLFGSDLEFDLPPAIRFRMLHPKLKIA